MTTPLGTFLSSQAQPGTFQPACLQGWRAHGWLWSQALSQRSSKLPSHCQPDAEAPEDSGAGYSTCPQGPLVPSKSITASHPPPPAPAGRPCPKASSLDSPGQQQRRPVHRRDPSVPLPHGGPWSPAPGRGAERPVRPGPVPNQSRAYVLSICPQAPPQTWTSCSGKMQTPRARSPRCRVGQENRQHRWAGPRLGQEEGVCGHPGSHSRADGPRPQAETQDSLDLPPGWETALWSGQPWAENRCPADSPAASPGGCAGIEASSGAQPGAPPPRHTSPSPSGWAWPPCPVALPSLRPRVKDPMAESGLGVTAQGPSPCSLGRAPLFSRLGLARGVTRHSVGTASSAGSTRPLGSAAGTACAGAPQRRASRKSTGPAPKEAAAW